MERIGTRADDAYKRAAIDYPSKLHGDRRQYLFTKPFGTDPWGDDLCGKLHDFAHLVEIFHLPRGAAVLDVGCGPGWLAEYFARMGYRATGIDISPEMIAIAGQRVRGLGFPAGGEGLDVTFAVADSEAFTLGREFDAAVIYDALHHFADERAVLRSVFAHLKPGGRLFMKEPQEHHPDAPETKAEVAEFGVLERGFSRNVLLDALADAGFLPPAALRQVDMMVGEERLAPGYVSAVLAATPAYHMLLAAKPGPGAIDSRWPGVLAADLSVTGVPGSIAARGDMRVEITAVNTGDTTWLHRSMRYGGYVRLGVQWLDGHGAMLVPDFASAPLPSEVQPGERVVWTVPLKAPADPGRYRLRFDLVDEFIAWFQDRGSRPAECPLIVE